MATIQKFEDIESWKSAREVVKMVYKVSSEAPFSKDFALCNQIRRSAISVVSNIAEGFEREGNKEFINFLSIAKGSCGEVRAQLYIALDQNYLDNKMLSTIYEKLCETSRQIAGFMRYLQQSEMRGHKFTQ